MTTARGRNNIAHRQRAVGLLTDDSRFAWLCDPERMRKGRDRRAWRPGLLAELGRIDDPEELRRVALRLCELRPTTIREGVAIVRRYRLGARPADALSFASAMGRVVDDFMIAHPGTRWETVRAGLHHVLDFVEKEAAKEQRSRGPTTAAPASELIPPRTRKQAR